MFTPDGHQHFVSSCDARLHATHPEERRVRMTTRHRAYTMRWPGESATRQRECRRGQLPFGSRTVSTHETRSAQFADPSVKLGRQSRRNKDR